MDCKLSGTFPNSMVNLTRLVHLDFSYNNISGNIPLLHNSKNLNYLDLSHNRLSGTLELSNNNLNGSIPLSWFELNWLNVLSLSSNHLTGSLQLETIFKLENLYYLDLSYNNLSIETSHNNSSENLIPQYTTFRLASCKLKSFPYLGNQSRLLVLDLSDNQIGGAIPSWTWNVGNGAPTYINFSQTQLGSFQEPCAFPGLSVLDLHSNQLTGQIPVPPETAHYVDYSANNFTSSISPDIGKNLTVAYFFSVSSNKLTGTIPDSICEAIYLYVLDLSNNGFSGEIPSCLLGPIEPLAILNFGNNNLTGHVNGNFVENCGLRLLDLHGNHIEGNVPRSLSNCTMLEVMNLGNNHLTDTFPCFMNRSSNLRVLVLRFNRFYGSTLCSGPRNHWPNLQIIDIALNQFTGKVPINWFVNWTGMMGSNYGAQLEINHLRYKAFDLDTLSYQDTVTLKNEEIKLKGKHHQGQKMMSLPSSDNIEWEKIFGEIGFSLGLGIVVLPLLFYKRWRRFYFEHVDHALSKIFRVHLS
ncbi:hypothetical protein POM88_036797 [Heracleum sosnowskyi]|uniref:Uncharacterized protein n=1 Tax=Heracleum sosnowskyi TaxID=360622 RepID=A0AAD8HRD7_9APIA|nr:hypothetical protein POM88_036797 [Heracleum sosnowskyi]